MFNLFKKKSSKKTPLLVNPPKRSRWTSPEKYIEQLYIYYIQLHPEKKDYYLKIKNELLLELETFHTRRKTHITI